MGAFSNDMRAVAKKLCKELGNSCELTKVTPGAYNPVTGKTDETFIKIPIFSAPVRKAADIFGLMGGNTNLSGFSDQTVIIPWFGQKLDTTWKYNGHNITEVSEMSSQNDVIIYTIGVGAKE